MAAVASEYPGVGMTAVLRTPNNDTTPNAGDDFEKFILHNQSWLDGMKRLRAANIQLQHYFHMRNLTCNAPAAKCGCIGWDCGKDCECCVIDGQCIAKYRCCNSIANLSAIIGPSLKHFPMDGFFADNGGSGNQTFETEAWDLTQADAPQKARPVLMNRAMAISFEGWADTADDVIKMPAALKKYPRSRFAALVHGVRNASSMRSVVDRFVAAGYGSISVVDDYSDLPAYWEEEVAYISSLNGFQCTMPIPTLWPIPSVSLSNSGSRGTSVQLLPSKFKFELMNNGSSSIIQAAFERYINWTFAGANPQSSMQLCATFLPGLQVSVRDINDALPSLSTNESYELHIPADGNPATLNAESVYGALRGLETFSQLVQIAGGDSPSIFGIAECPRVVRDRPRFVHRGLMLDTGRRFFPKAMLLQIIEAMGMSKLNVLHLHLAEEGGFRVESKRFPELTRGVRHYSQSDIKELIEFARLRGVRVVPEVDLPMHASDLVPLASTRGIQFCNDSVRVELFNDPQTNATAKVVSELLEEMSSLFPDPVFHIGTDETILTQKCTLENLRDFERQILDMVMHNKKVPM
eukprot:g196.t1